MCVYVSVSLCLCLPVCLSNVRPAVMDELKRGDSDDREKEVR